MNTHFEHATAQLSAGVRLHYVTAGGGSDTIVLLHGYPQTWYEWRHVIGPLVPAGFRVIAPDYRGAGLSSKPSDGYSAPWRPTSPSCCATISASRNRSSSSATTSG